MGGVWAINNATRGATRNELIGEGNRKGSATTKSMCRSGIAKASGAVRDGSCGRSG